MRSLKACLGLAALAIGAYAATAGVASAQSQVTCTVTGTVPNISLTCGGVAPPPPNAPSCSALSPDQSSLAAAGTVNLTASCAGASVYKWSASPTPSGAFASQTNGGSNSASVAATTTFSVQGCLADATTCSNPVSTSVAVGGAPPPPPGGGGGFCSQYTNVQQITMPWGGGYNTAGGAGFAANATLVIAFTVPPDYPNPNVGNINWAEFSGAPTTRLITLSTQPCDFRLSGGFDPTGATAPMTAANSGLGALSWSLSAINNPSSPVAQLFPGQTYYVNIQNKYLRTGAQTCTKGYCDIIVLMSMP